MIRKGVLKTTVFRAGHPKFMETAGLDIGSMKVAGRFNAKGTRALYTALDPETAWLEYQQGEPEPRPCVIIGLTVSLKNYIDFSAGYEPAGWSDNWKHALEPGWRLEADWCGWKCGQEVIQDRCAGLVVPSTQNGAKAGRNLILFQDVRRVGESWVDHDPFDDIGQAIHEIGKPVR